MARSARESRRMWVRVEGGGDSSAVLAGSEGHSRGSSSSIECDVTGVGGRVPKRQAPLALVKTQHVSVLKKHIFRVFGSASGFRCTFLFPDTCL